MKFMFKRIFHILLVIAVVYACPFNVYAENNIPLTTPVPLYCDIYGHDLTVEFADEPAFTNVVGTVDHCYDSYHEPISVYCTVCEITFDSDIVLDGYDYDVVSHGHDFDITHATLPDGGIKEIYTCNVCSYSFEKIYYPYSIPETTEMD